MYLKPQAGLDEFIVRVKIEVGDKRIQGRTLGALQQREVRSM